MTKVYAALKIALLSFFIAFSVADADVILTVTGDNVNLRAIADGESEVVAQVSHGDILHADKFIAGDWVGVAVPSGVAVWVYAELVRDDVVAVSKLSVRSGPGITYRTVGMLLKGDKVVSHGTLNGWMKIDAPANCRVWISSKYVESADGSAKKMSVAPDMDSPIKPVAKVTPKPESVMPDPVLKPMPKLENIVEPAPVPIPIKPKPLEKPEVTSSVNAVVPAVIPVVKSVIPMPESSTNISEELVLDPLVLPKKKEIKEPAPPRVLAPVKLNKPTKPEVGESGIIPDTESKTVLRLDKPIVKLEKEAVVTQGIDVAVASVIKVEEPISMPAKPIKVKEPKYQAVNKVSLIIEAKPFVPPVVDNIDVPKKEKSDESVVELDSMLATEELEDMGKIPATELEASSSSVIAVGQPLDVSSISEVIPTPELAVVPVMPEDKIKNIEPVVHKSLRPTGQARWGAHESDLSNDKPVVQATVKKNKYPVINPDDIPAGIDYKQLVSTMPQGKSVILTGHLKLASYILHRPSRYRLVGDDNNCYVVADNYNLDLLLGATIEITGKAYWIQGVRDMVVWTDDIKKILVLTGHPE